MALTDRVSGVMAQSALASAGNVKVVCRFKPMSEKERGTAGNFPNVQEVPDFKTVVVKDPNSKQSMKFVFDKVYDVDATQEEIYKYAAAPVIQSVIQGFNGTIFAYGQTASGKTHTMEGDVSNMHSPESGVIPRMVQHMFDSISNCDENVQFRIKVSIVELYMEKLRDLLDSTKVDLKIRSDKTRGVFIENLTEQYISSPEEVYQLINVARNSRSVASTNMNEQSSRSHVLFIVTIRQNSIDGQNARNGKLYLVDLAGSEKIGKTGAEGCRLDQAKKINMSLTALGKVINALTDGKSTHVPYRDSKLTRVLQESLGGNSKTTLVVTCSSHPNNLPETISTLRFGMAAKKIKNKPEINKELTVSELQEKLSKAEKKIVDRETYILQLKNYITGDLKQKCPEYSEGRDLQEVQENDPVKELERRLEIQRHLHISEEEQYNALKIKCERALAEKEEIQSELRDLKATRAGDLIKIKEKELERENNVFTAPSKDGEDLLRELEEITTDTKVIEFLRGKLGAYVSQKNEEQLSRVIDELKIEKEEKRALQDKVERSEKMLQKKLVKLEHNLCQLTHTYFELVVIQQRFKSDNCFLKKSIESKDCTILSLKKRIKELEEHNLQLENEIFEEPLPEYINKLAKSSSGGKLKSSSKMQRNSIQSIELGVSEAKFLEAMQKKNNAPKVVKVVKGGRHIENRENKG